MAEQRVYQGQVYTRRAPGEPWVLAGPAQAGGAGRVVTLPPNPERVAASARADEAAARAAAADARSAAAAERAAREWTATHNPDGSKIETQEFKPLPDGAAKRYEDQINAFAAYDRAIGGFLDDYAGNAWTGELENRAQNILGTGTPGQAEWWADFRTADNQIRNALFGASLTAGEKQAYAETTITPRMTPERVRENLERRLALAQGVLSRKTGFLRANGYNPEAIDALAGEYVDRVSGQAQQHADTEVPDPAVAAPVKNDGPTNLGPADLPPANMPGGDDPTPPIFGANNPAPETIAEGAGFLGLTGGTRNVDDPATRSRIASMINAGAGFATINATLKDRGLPPMSFREWDAVQQWKRTTGKPYPASSVRLTQEVPLSFGERVAGSEGAAFGAQAANAATAGIPAYLAGGEGQRALDAMAAVHPKSSTAGMFTGGVTGAVGAEAALAARAPMAFAKFAPRAADTLYGATSGFTGAEEGHRLEGALTGAVLAPLAGSAGERAMRAAGATFRGVTDPNVRYLYDRGVPLTVGQTVGNSGRIGATVKGVEDALTSVPGPGNMIEARRREGLDAFNRLVFQDAAAPGAQVTSTGAPGMQQVRQSVTDAYGRALDPVTIDANEEQFINDLATTIQAAQRIPNVAPTNPQDFAMNALGNRINGAVDPNTDLMTGRGFQEAYRGLARSGRERAKSDYGFEIGQVTRQGQDALGEVLERQNPGAFEGFLEANAANRRANVLADALTRAANQGDEMITPGQLNRADVQSTSRLEGKVNSASGNRPFYDLASAGQAVLPSRLPDSGTMKRLIVGGLTTGAFGGAGAAMGGGEGAAGGTGLGIGAALALTLGGTKGGQALMRELLLNRPEVLRAAGEAVQNNARLGGGFGAGVLAPLLVGPQH